jgi:hypothetical protein
MFKEKITVLLATILISSTSLVNGEENNINNLILGGRYLEESKIEQEIEVDNDEESYSLERFFRPSNTPILNTKRNLLSIDDYNKNPSDIKINKELLKTPEDTIVNYFSILREAANPLDNTKTGCGSLGDTKGPYPYAYNFLSKSYKDKVSYDEYLNSFKNQLHINLIKLNQVTPDENNTNDLKYFVELEIIKGSEEKLGLFAYYFGYIYLEKEDNVYKINDMSYTGENYLCAPYHGWSYDAQSFVEIEYGNWCSLIDSKIIVKQNGYEKKVYFSDKDKNEYYVLFYQLTNGVDIKISDYKKDKDGKWNVVYINPQKCLDKNK